MLERPPSALLGLLFAGILLAAGGAHGAGSRLAGPIEARVDQVIDGDTLAVVARIWIDQEITVRVRAKGVDAPEARGARCPEERRQGEAAQAFLHALVGAGPVYLSEVEPDKYAGRVDAVVTLPDGRNLAAVLIAAGHGRPYSGAARASACQAP